ncbi:MAG: phosphomethylpyrimidine synthase ThiC [Methanoregulaceae archaeon]|nr:phosphomethylpyrimidine synthase ThiC [Methanoregulaceae archaeon]
MKTESDAAREGTITGRVEKVASDEGIEAKILSERVAAGSVVIMHRGKVAIGIGQGLRTKVNVNIGTSPACCNPDEEVEKARIAERYGADTISDLSMAGDISATRKRISAATSLPLTTVPLYQTVAETGLDNLTCRDFIRTIRMQAKEGISSLVLHMVSRTILKHIQESPRVLGIVSKGGSMMAAHMILGKCENPYLECFEDILSITKKHDIVISLGNTMRSGCISDARDRLHAEEMRANITLADRAHEEGVQVIIEGVGGHVHAGRISRYIRDYKRKMPYPLFVAGPLPTDIAMGYDHIAGCVGASLASGAGADYLCYLTPAEHIGLPTRDEVKEGLIAFRIAAHIGDTIKYGSIKKDEAVARRRAELDWKGQADLALDPERICQENPQGTPCSMCGPFCAIRIMKEFCNTRTP